MLKITYIQYLISKNNNSNKKLIKYSLKKG